MPRRPKLGSIYLRGSTYWIKFYAAGQCFRESAETGDYEEAEKQLKRRQGEVVTGRFGGLKPERIRFRELAAEVVSDYEENGRSSAAHVERRLKLHILPVLGDVRAAQLGTEHLKRYIARRREDKASPATINRELAIIRRAFSLALRSDPPKVLRAPHVPMLAEKNIRTGFLEHDQYVKLRGELPEPVRPLFVVAYYTGARIGELKNLRWDQVDFQAKRITLHPLTTKNREGRTLPIYGEMREWLSIEKEIRDAKWPACPWVFRRGGKPVRNFRKSWAAACTRAGVPGLLFHDLRRTAVRNMVRAGIPEKICMAISGHKTRSVFDRYNVVNERDLDLAAERMERHIEALGTKSGTIADSKKAPLEKSPRKSLN